jgi:AAA+ ATPase superfamily predicted ATPase
LFSRDVFDYALPLEEDMYFFGRAAVVSELVDSIRKSENRGVFGLRKTGKTSILYKVRRVCADSNIASVIYLDCKRSNIRSKSWTGLLRLITESIIKVLKLPRDTGKDEEADDRFLMVVKKIPISKKVCIIFDEIEFISPLAKQNRHWRKEFLDFWQLLCLSKAKFDEYASLLLA